MKLSMPISILFATLFLTGTVGTTKQQASPQSVLPNPVLYLTSTELVTQAGKTFVRYHFDVQNKAAYPAAMFAAAPDLPPCGENKNSSRTWVDIFDQRGKRLYGFCALGKPDDLSKIWFEVAEDVVPPSWIYIEMTDRQANTKYKSNLSETTL